MIVFVRDLGEAFRKTSHMREALMSSWARFRINYRCPDAKGSTILHVAAAQGQTKLVAAMGHLNPEIDQRNNAGDTALHLAAEYDQPGVIESLLKHGAGHARRNDLGFAPAQIAAVKCHRASLEVLLKYGSDVAMTTDHGETLLHLACRGVWSRFLQLREDLTRRVNRLDSVEHARPAGNYCNELECTRSANEDALQEESAAVLGFLLDAFRRQPELLRAEDAIGTSPGTVLHYFACFNYLEGARALLREPFSVDASRLNKNGLSALWIAAWFNNTRLGRELLAFGADPNDSDPVRNVSPLHAAIYGYHIERVDETCDFVDDLLASGADPRRADVSGESAAHLVIGTLDFRVMSKFVDALGAEALEMEDDSGNSLFHYAVGILDDVSIYKMIVEKVMNTPLRTSILNL